MINQRPFLDIFPTSKQDMHSSIMSNGKPKHVLMMLTTLSCSPNLIMMRVKLGTASPLGAESSKPQTEVRCTLSSVAILRAWV